MGRLVGNELSFEDRHSSDIPSVIELPSGVVDDADDIRPVFIKAFQLHILSSRIARHKVLVLDSDELVRSRRSVYFPGHLK